MNGHRATAAQPGGEVLDADVDVGAHASFRDAVIRRGEEVSRRDGDVLLLAAVDLVGRGHDAVEHLGGKRDHAGVRDPGAVVAVVRLAFLVDPDLLEGFLVLGLVALHRNEGAHAANRGCAALMAGLDGEFAVVLHHRHGHRDLGAVGQDARAVVAEFLDVTEDVVPAPAVEARRVLAQFVQDLVHLEGRQDGLDQHRALDGAAWHAQAVFSEVEHVVPQPRFQVRFHLGQVEVRPAAPRQQLFGVVEEVQPEVEQRPGHGLAVHRHMFFGQVPAARAGQQHGGFLVQAVLFAVLLQADGAPDGVAQVDLALHAVVPGGRGGVLEVGHEHPRSAVQGVDDHFPVDRPGDLHPAVLQVGGQRVDFPVPLADLAGAGQEVGLLAGVQAFLAFLAVVQQFQAAVVEAAVQLGHERQRLRRQDLGVTVLDGASDLHSLGQAEFRHDQSVTGLFQKVNLVF